MMLMLLLLIVVLFALWWTSKLYIYYVKLRKFPGPTPLPLIGNAHYFNNGSDIIKNFLYFQKKYKNSLMYKIMLGPNSKLIISNHRAAEILHTSTTILDKSYEYKFLYPWLGLGLLTSRTEKWRVHRKLITPTFHFKILDQFIDIFNSQSEVFVKCLAGNLDGNPFNAMPLVSAAALDIICETAMGVKVNAQTDSNSKYVKSVKEMTHLVGKRMFTPLFFNDTIYSLTDNYKKEQKTLSFLHGFTNSVILKRHQKLKNSISTAESHSDLQDNDDIGEKKKTVFMDLLLQCSVKGQPLSNEDIRSEVDTFMFEGHDTVTAAISFSLYCLSQNQDVQENVVEELRTIFSDDKFRRATHEDFNSMKYLEMVIKESMRLYPPVTMYARHINSDTEFGDDILPEGTTVMIFPHGLHRQPDIFPDPEKFDPDRFSSENTLKRPVYAYIPFSAGSRNCIGQRFAYLSMKSILASVLRNYQILPVENYTPDLIFDVILHTTNGLMIKIKKRQF